MNGPKARASPLVIGSRPCLGKPHSRGWSISPNYASGLSATTKNSNKRSAWDITKGASGEAFIITRRCALPPTPSWLPSAAFSPQEKLEANLDSHKLEFPEVNDLDQAPVRTERHNPTSIATLRKELVVALVRRLPRCPYCQQRNDSRSEMFDVLIE